VSDDWRLTVELADGGNAPGLVNALREVELEDAHRSRVGERVVVSQDEGNVFLYADTEERARQVNALVQERLAELRFDANVALTRWHPVEQRWEDASVPLPTSDEEWQAEHERLQADEAAESAATGHAAWEVRVVLPSHEDTVSLAERLEREGIPAVRRARFLLVGAVNEDEARALAERLRSETPAGSRIEVEPGGQMAWEVAPQNPFAFFGGLGG
jgi:hypothetical protein